MRIFVIVMCAAVVAGCLQADADNGLLKCSSNPKRRCPEGYFCAANDTCWKNGSTGAPPAAGGKRQGQGCTVATECDTGYCADGICCDSPCDGQCQACDGGRGACTTVTGQPHGHRQPCATAGFDACASVCDGNDAKACTYPTWSTSCGAQTCFGPPATLKSATACDGAGRCSPTNGAMLLTPCPAPAGGTAICSGEQCDFVCNPPYQRQGSSCVNP